MVPIIYRCLKNLLPVETFPDVFLSAVKIFVPGISIDLQN